MNRKIKVAFVCTGNSCRSQMAEGLAKCLGSEVIDAYSAGTEPAGEVDPIAVLVMQELGIDISANRPKMMDSIPQEIDILITMGCGVICPYIPNKHKEDWGIVDPIGKSVEVFRETRDFIKQKVYLLINDILQNELT